MPKFALSDAVQARNEITYNQYKDIQKLYMDVADEAKKKAEEIKDLNLSGKLQAIELNKLEKELQRAAATIGVKVNEEIKSSMKDASQATFQASGKMFEDIGVNIKEAYRNVPDDIVEMLVTGKIYDGDWSLSSAIWKDIKDTQSDITNIVAKGVAMNKSAYDIAKDLEKYVDPSARKDWEWSKVYPGTKKKIDYSAQRLARTMVSHAYQQSLVRACKDNPFVDGFIWRSAGTERTCEICEARDGEFFLKDELPLDHPNGLCTYLTHTQKSLNDIADDLMHWAIGEENPELDKWMDSMEIAKGYTKEAKETTEKQWALSEEQKAYLQAAGMDTWDIQDRASTKEDYESLIGDGDFYVWKSAMQSGMEQSNIDAIYRLAHDKGLTLQGYYDKFIKNPFYVETKKVDYSFVKKQFLKEVKKKVPEFTWWQDKFLGKIGYNVDHIPTYDEWILKAQYDSKLINSFDNYASKAGMSWEEFYNSKLGKVKYKYVTVQEIVGGKSQGANSNGNSSIPNWQEWISICKSQTIEEMTGYEKDQHTLFTYEEKSALRTYTGNAYEDINSYFRDQWWGKRTESEARLKYGDDVAELADKCFNALKKTSFDKGIVTRRGTSIGEIAGFLGGSDYRTAKREVREIIDNNSLSEACKIFNDRLSGSICSYSSLVSSSSIWDKGFNGEVEMVFYTPENIKGLASIMDISNFGTLEGETLMDNDLRIKIHHIEESDGHKYSDIRVYAEVLGVGEK